MPGNNELQSTGPSICERIVPSLHPTENSQTQDKSLPKCTSSMESKIIQLPSHSHTEIITSHVSTEGIVNVCSTISSIHIMPSVDDMPSCGPSVCERIVPSHSPAANGQTLDKSLSKCTSPRESLNIPLPSWNVHKHNKLITSHPSRKGIVNVPSLISSIHIMPSEDDFLSNGSSACERIFPSLQLLQQRAL